MHHIRQRHYLIQLIIRFQFAGFFRPFCHDQMDFEILPT
jgi:hypothetical protein